MIKPIPWYKFFSISDEWVVYYKWIEKNVSTNRLWYKKTRLWSRKSVRVHRLVALTFLWDIEWKVVMHLDDNPSNNCVSNLRIGTMKDNVQDMVSKCRNKNWAKKKDIDDSILQDFNNWLSKKDMIKKYWVHPNTVLFWKKRLWLNTNRSKYDISFITNVINYDWNNTKTWKQFWISDMTVMRWRRKYLT